MAKILNRNRPKLREAKPCFPGSWWKPKTTAILMTAYSFRPYRSRWLQLRCSGDGAGGSTAVQGRQGTQTTPDEAYCGDDPAAAVAPTPPVLSAVRPQPSNDDFRGQEPVRAHSRLASLPTGGGLSLVGGAVRLLPIRSCCHFHELRRCPSISKRDALSGDVAPL